MKQTITRIIQVIIMSSAGLGCGSGEHGGFESLTGNWRFDSRDHLTATGCTGSPQGFTGVLRVTQTGDEVVPTDETGTQSFWKGNPTTDGFEIISETDVQCSPNNPGKQRQRIIVSEIAEATSIAYGVANYAFESSCSDGSDVCQVTAVGPTKHFSN